MYKRQIPGNDDSPRAVALFANVISTAVMEGLALRKQNRIDSASVEKAPAKKAKPAGKDGVAHEKKAGSAPIKTEKKSLVAEAQDSAKPKPAAAKAKAAEVKVAEKKAPAKKAKPAVKVKAVAKKVDGASEDKAVEKKLTAAKATKKSDAEK